ncbi:unnamed protein product [Meganyctiphanes norvegica]|uniref:Membrane protein BRI3 n=1 Tax=Meganyctiphanes norvegica TaxID=48144 RepID=A0AAV2RMI4_MEGNR
MESKPPPYNPNMPQSTMSPPPPYQPMPPPPSYHPGPNPPPIGFIPTANTSIYTQNSTYGAIPVVVQPVRATDVIVVGGCPACRVGVLSEEFTLPGLCCAFWFFPIGVLCCLAMKERRCTNCGAIFT